MCPSKRRTPATIATIRRLALALPGVTEGTSYGTPAFRVSRQLFARMHQEEPAVILRIDRDARDILIADQPQTFFITDHYLEHPWVLARLAIATDVELEGMLEQAWRRCATQRLLEEYDDR